MSEIRILYITANQLSLYWSVAGKLYLDSQFEATTSGYAKFADAIKQYPDIKSVILLDIIEEEYRSDTIPHVFGKDSRSIQQRKLIQLYHRTEYRCCEIQGREKTGRRDDKILYAAITNPDKITPWTAILNQAKTPMAGIYSLSGLSSLIVSKAKIQSPNVLLITEQGGNTLRQTFLQNRHVKISRTSTLTAKERTDLSGVIQRESEKNKRYLNRIQVLPQNAVLDVYVICRSEDRDGLKTSCVDMDLIHFHWLTEDDVAQRIGLQSELRSGFCEELFIHLLSSAKPKLNYAPADDQVYHRLHVARKFMAVASVLMMFACVGWSAMTVMDAKALAADTINIEQQTRNLREGYLQLKKQLPETEIAPVNMQSVVNIAKTLDKYKANPQLMMSYLSDGLQQFSKIQIDEIAWMSSDQPNAEFEAGAASSMQVATEESEVAPEVVQQQNFQIAVVKASLKYFDGNFKSAFRVIENFADTLRASRNFYQVEILSFPLNIDSHSTLLMTSGKDTIDNKAVFELRAVVQVQQPSTTQMQARNEKI